MPDNVSITAATGVVDVAADEIGGVKFQRAKIGHGVDGSYADASAANPLPVGLAAGAAVGSGRVAVAAAGTRVALPARPGVLAVIVRARPTNAGTVYVGGSDVAAANGFELAAGDAVSMDVSDPSAVYVDAATSGDAVTYLWVAA